MASTAAEQLDTQIEALIKTLEEKIAEHGEHSVQAAPAYVAYAKALLQKAQLEGDPFGGALKKEEDAAPADEDEDAAEDEAVGSDGEGDAADGPGDESDDLELSFQCLEGARLVYEKHGGHELALADVCELLAEVSMENEMWEQAIGEIRQALDLKKARLPVDDRQIAHLHYQLATAAAAQLQDAQQALTTPEAADAPPRTEAPHATVARCQALAAEHYTLAAHVLEQRQVASSSADEAAELAEVLAEVRAKVEEHTVSGGGGKQRVGSGVEGFVQSTTIGFGAEASTTIGFGAEASTTIGFGAEATTTIGFCAGSAGGSAAGSSQGFAPPSASMPVTCLGVVGGASGRKKAILVPLTSTPTGADDGSGCAPLTACAPIPTTTSNPETVEAAPKRARLMPTPTSTMAN